MMSDFSTDRVPTLFLKLFARTIPGHFQALQYDRQVIRSYIMCSFLQLYLLFCTFTQIASIFRSNLKDMKSMAISYL